MQTGLAKLDSGAPISAARAQLFAKAGFASQEPQTDGSTAWTLTNTGKALLPKPAPAAPQASQQPVCWKNVQKPRLTQFPQIGAPNSTANQTFIRAFHLAGNDPSKALAVAQAVFGATR